MPGTDLLSLSPTPARRHDQNAGRYARRPGRFVTDTGPVALIGALCDPKSGIWQRRGYPRQRRERAYSLLCPERAGDLWGSEHHTGASPGETPALIRRLADGTLTSERS